MHSLKIFFEHDWLHGRQWDCTIHIRSLHSISAYPQVKSFGRSKNIVWNETLELECKAWGWPQPNVSWSRARTSGDGAVYNLFDRRVSLHNGTTGVENAMLRMVNTTYTDRATYFCTAMSEVNGTTQTLNASIFVRVKGLWK